MNEDIDAEDLAAIIAEFIESEKVKAALAAYRQLLTDCGISATDDELTQIALAISEQDGDREQVLITALLNRDLDRRASAKARDLIFFMRKRPLEPPKLEA